LNKTSNEFDQTEERRYPIDFISPYSRVKKVVLEIPEGYVIEEMPKSKKIVTEDKEIEYNYIIEQKGISWKLFPQPKWQVQIIRKNIIQLLNRFGSSFQTGKPGNQSGKKVKQ
jgi:predicted subunit of tRNA(5-methylaminomethyl-2-thiouridylate) methyltransferase